MTVGVGWGARVRARESRSVIGHGSVGTDTMSRSPKLHDSPKIRRINSAATNGLSRSGLNRSGGDISLSDSLRRIALQQAVADSDEFTELTRSISGRLGYRGLNSSNATPVPEGLELPNEGTRLLDSPGLTIDSLS
eukprot:scaffold24642_cov68-Cyclotella_meneghiniana.AAC.11